LTGPQDRCVQGFRREQAGCSVLGRAA